MGGHSERSHRRFSPSQAERFIACRGSTNLLARVPARPSTEWSIEGTKAHEVLQAGLENGIRDAKEAHREYSTVFAEDLDDGENFFYRAVQAALDHVYGILDDYPDAVLYVERFVNPPSEVTPGETGGYCDIAIHVPSIRTLFIIDYKHGAGIAKDVKGNPQPMQYGAGFLYEDNAVVDPATVDMVVLTIVQPRAFHPDGIIREHEVTPYELYEYIAELDDVIEDCLKPDAPLTPDDNGKTSDHCRFCDANTMCPARERKAISAVGTQFAAVTDVTRNKLPDLMTLDMERLVYISRMAPILKKFLDDVDGRIMELLRQGYSVPGKKLVEVQAKRQWWGSPEDVAAKAAALANCKPDELYTMKLLPITQVEKVIVEAFKKRVGRGKKSQAAEDARRAFAFLTTKQSSGNLTMVDADDPRPAVQNAVSAFTQIDGALATSTETQDTEQ